MTIRFIRIFDIPFVIGAVSAGYMGSSDPLSSTSAHARIHPLGWMSWPDGFDPSRLPAGRPKRFGSGSLPAEHDRHSPAGNGNCSALGNSAPPFSRTLPSVSP